MERPPLINIGNATKVKTAISNDRIHIGRDLAEITGWGKSVVHNYDNKIRLENVRGICMIVNFPTSSIIQMTCSGGSNIQLIKFVHKLHYLTFFIQNVYVNAEVMDECTSNKSCRMTA